MAPSLVIWPMMTTAVPLNLSKRTSPRGAFAPLRHGCGERCDLSQRHGLDGIDHEERDASFDRQREHLVQVILIH